MFNYEEFTTRNIGFVTEQEQAQLRDATVFVCGTGGMGGACILALVRAGVGNLIIADIDEFEISNLNRQVFCNIDTIDRHKAEATGEQCLKINPEINLTILREDWPNVIEQTIETADVIINGTDDLSASLLLYRTARIKKKTVVDAYASPLPSVYVTGPVDPMPEERLGYQTIGEDWNRLNDEHRNQAFLCEAEYVILHSSSRHYIDLDLAGEVAAGRRSRMSFAPMVITTGMLMAYEAIGQVLKRQNVTDCYGWFFNPYRAAVEKRRNALVAALFRPIVRRYLQKLIHQA